MYDFNIIIPTADDWSKIENAYDSTCYQTKAWYNYICAIGYKPIIISVYEDNSCIGYFIGEKIGHIISLVTAPFEGIGTYTQGLCMLKEIDHKTRVKIYKELAQWLFNTSRASYLQVEDWQIREDRTEWIPYSQWRYDLLDEEQIPYEVRATLHVSLKDSEENLWAGLHYKSAKYSVNKARKLGLTVEQITDKNAIDAFVNVHYDQLKEVCQRKGTHPKKSQTKARMRALCNALFPNRVFMLQVVGNDDQGEKQIMATGIFCIDKGECSYWTGASYAKYQNKCPNELLVWEAMRLMSREGAGDLNFCGMASYKLKFGTKYAYVPRMIFFKYKWLYSAKTLAKNLYYNTRQTMQNIKRALLK